MNLTHLYFTGDWSWIDAYVASMGEDEFRRYMNRLYIRLDRMKIGEVYSIPEHVVPENFDLFIKMAEWFMLDMNRGSSDKMYEFNDEYTEIKCVRSWKQTRRKNTGEKKKSVIS